MDVYFTSKNTGPSWGSDPKHLVYVGTSLDEAMAAVGDFARYEKPWPLNTMYPDIYSALPSDTEREMIKYYMADGWWYTVVMVKFEVPSA